MERLYLVNENTYLHMQECDEGWDFTLYDKETMKDIDGGRLDIEDGAYTLDEAFDEIVSMFGMDVITRTEIEDPDDLIEKLQSNCF